MAPLSPQEKQNLILLLESKNADNILVGTSMLEGFDLLNDEWFARIIPYICYDEESLLSWAEKDKIKLFWTEQKKQYPSLKRLWPSFMIFIHGDGYHPYSDKSAYTYIANRHKHANKYIWKRFVPYRQIYKNILASSVTDMWTHLFFKTACNLQISFFEGLHNQSLWFIDTLVECYSNNPLYCFLHGYLHGIIYKNHSKGLKSFEQALACLKSPDDLALQFEKILETHFKGYYPHDNRFYLLKKRYLEFYPTQILLLRYLTDLYLKLKNTKQALHHAEQAYQLTNNDSDIPFVFLGSYYYSQGNISKAISILKVGIAATPIKQKGIYPQQTHQRHQIHLDEKASMAVLLGDIQINHYEDANKAMSYYRQAKEFSPKLSLSHQRRILIALYVYKDVVQAEILLNNMIRFCKKSAFTEKYKTIIKQKRGY
ncbi:MAG: hypothetical protein GY810_17265 [Aureispira sp.]|nr:hypothetical protein [Aureispira sp.]